MKLQNQYFQMELCDETGSLLSFSNGKREMIGEKSAPLFALQLLDKNGDGIYLNSLYAQQVEFDTKHNGDETIVKIHYKGILAIDLDVTAQVRVLEKDPISYWSLSVNNQTEYSLEWVDFPGVLVPNDLKGIGGDAVLFWPAMEGCLIENTALRSESGYAYKQQGGQTIGYSGMYPGACPTQFMAYYTPDGGLYFASHDNQCNLKTVEHYPFDDGIRMEYKLFTGAASGHYQMEYEIALGVFEGDWHDAADIYRDWMEHSGMQLPQKLYENKNLPEWYAQSPVIVSFPVRGTKDSGDMTPNQYFPLENSIPYIDRLSEEFESKIMALPMQWEGTAPWAPPYVWPPLGGEKAFCDWIEKLHEKNHLAGVYCSGIGWTTKSFLEPSYSAEEKYDPSIMTKTPHDVIAQSKILGYPIRRGYDMCCSQQKTADIVCHEIEKLAETGCDYTQYFDQNLGGNGCFCYARDHGHSPAPGKWQNDAMIKIFKQIQKVIEKKDSNMLIGCEAATAEPFIGYLPLSDLRYNINFFFGKPVPAYGYVYHEYINNFMGNQNSIHAAIDLLGNPDNLLFRTAYSFVSGDMLMVILADKGNIAWAWDVSWDVEPPQQDNIKTLIKNLNGWRTGNGKDFLFCGRMEKPYQVKTYDDYKLVTKNTVISYPSVLSSRWRAPDGKDGQILVNYQTEPKTVYIIGDTGFKKLYNDPHGEAKEFDCQKEIFIPPLSAVLITE